MKGSNIVSAIHHLKIAVEHLQDFQRSHPGSKGANLFKQYQKRIEWIPTDLISHPFLPDLVRQGVKVEWQSDAFAPEAINEKIHLLNPEQRDLIETEIDKMLEA